MIQRKLVDVIRKDFFRGKVIAILGPRQSGKTTLLEQLSIPQNQALKYNCDDQADIQELTDLSIAQMRSLVGGSKYIIIDEAQRVNNIGLLLKMLADEYKNDIQVIVSGSSSLDLNNDIQEPATGRLLEYNLYPFSISELAENSSWREQDRLLSTRMIYGLYPEVVTDSAHNRQTLQMLTNNYLYKDILSYKGMRKPEILQNILQALALQVGSEISYNELSRLVGVDKATVENYINLLEQCFVVFKLNSFSRNIRSEIRKGKKIYFYDNGVRNALIRNFAPLELRQDVGMLWENLMMSERKKANAINDNYANLYFWRTHEQQEIDLIEERDGQIQCYEFKFNKNKKATLPSVFEKNYANTTFNVVSTENYKDFVC